jgi:SAM-dependent methyltransferase
LDCGSLDINGSNRYLFENCEYIGIDIGEGKNVDIVSLIHEFNGDDESYDTIISTECFEHDMYYKESIKNIIRLLKPGGLFIFTCATTGRPEHGTINTSITDSPLLKGEWSKYYKNLTEEDIRDIIIMENIFIDFKFSINKNHKDLFFYGIKK